MERAADAIALGAAGAAPARGVNPLTVAERLSEEAGCRGWLRTGGANANRSNVEGVMAMRRMVVRYQTRPEHTAANQELIEGVFRELAARRPDGVRYLVLRLADGGFLHFVTVETDDGASPLPGLAAFRAFQDGIKERCAEPPQAVEATVIGNYRVLA
jgi:hypothetical protein